MRFVVECSFPAFDLGRKFFIETDTILSAFSVVASLSQELISKEEWVRIRSIDTNPRGGSSD